MAKSLIIVESPAKTKTLKNFLGPDYAVEASMGHVRDLPKSRIGVDVEHDFAPTYQPIPDRKDVLKKLAQAAKGVETVYLASDPDREGEAIAWHLAEALGLKNPHRIEFNEITKTAVQQALARPRTIDTERVNAQQARRVLDRLIGYKLSPVLSQKIQKGATAGRVQSVAVRLICEREREIQAFVPEEYWSLTATLTPQGLAKPFLFPAKLNSRSGVKLEPKTADEVTDYLRDLGEPTLAEFVARTGDAKGEMPAAQGGARYVIGDVKRREQKRNPSAPFITSTLQQEASRKLGFGNRRTMSVAQELYEGIELGAQGSVGLITYMRTDSVRVAGEAQAEARRFVEERYGRNYLPDTPRTYKTKSAAQDAHEAIRPTSAYRDPESVAQYLSSDQLRLYRLIWQRFLASQMSAAVLDVTTADVNAEPPAGGAPYVFRATGTVVKFDGFMRVYTEGKDTEEAGEDEQPPLPPLSSGMPLDLRRLDPRQHFTEPPPRYTEATIVKALEEQGIGRPSTYASIISTIRDREYVELRDKRFYPTELGFKVTDQLVKHFPTIMDVKFTAEMEDRLDEVEGGREDWVAVLHRFYGPFQQSLEAAKTGMENLKPAPVETDYRCSVTGNVMLLRQSRFGQFMGCSGYPECKKILKLNPDGTPVEGAEFSCGKIAVGAAATKEVVDPSTLPNATKHVCPEGKGVMLERSSRYGPFLGCSNYPKCQTTLKIDPTGELLPGQEFACTYSETAKKGRSGKAKASTGKSTAAKSTTAKSAPAKSGGAKAPTKRASPAKKNGAGEE